MPVRVCSDRILCQCVSVPEQKLLLYKLIIAAGQRGGVQPCVPVPQTAAQWVCSSGSISSTSGQTRPTHSGEDQQCGREGEYSVLCQQGSHWKGEDGERESGV